MDIEHKKQLGFLFIGILIIALVAAGWFLVVTLQQSQQPIIVEIPDPITGQVVLSNKTTLPLRIDPRLSIGIFANDLQAPRDIVSDANDTLIVSITRPGRVMALPDSDRDGRADRAINLLESRNNPHGLALDCPSEASDTPTICTLYIAEEDALYSFTYNQDTVAVSNERRLADLPTGGRHTTRSLLFNPGSDNKQLLVSIGSSCDVCRESDDRRGTIQLYDIQTGTLEPFALGLRNAVFLAEHPRTGQVWATEMGRDQLGDDIPPDEINIIKQEGNYGWPICYGNNIHDLQFDKNTYLRNPCMLPFEAPSFIDIQAHSAPLGLAFFDSELWPPEMRDDLLVAYHGSWNRTEPTGYKLVWYEFDETGALTNTIDAISGWLAQDGEQENAVIGRPAGIHRASNGMIYVSDDEAGVIYTISPRP